MHDRNYIRELYGIVKTKSSRYILTVPIVICRIYEVATFVATETQYSTCVGLRAVSVALAMSGVEGHGAETEGRDPVCGGGKGDRHDDFDFGVQY